MPMPQKWALLSVSDKTGLVEFANQLIDSGYQLLASGGTAKLLHQAELAVTEVSDFTGFPEIFDGRVKTLHPHIYAGILARRDQAADLATLNAHDLHLIDMVVVNLYPFAATIAKPNCSQADAIENIDIGGPTLIRAAAKNHADVTVVIDPADYPRVAQAEAATLSELRAELARKAFAHTASYDQCIANYLAKPSEVNNLPAQLSPSLNQQQRLRYGENPHQAAAIYTPGTSEQPNGSLSQAKICQGKALSYNNFVDADAAWQCVKNGDQQQARCVIVKHANPCGVAQTSDLTSAYQRAYQTDSTSSFGGIIAFNQTVEEKTAQTILDQQFVEVILAPHFSQAALTVFANKPNLRILEMGDDMPHTGLQIKTLSGGHWLVQQPDQHTLDIDTLTICTQRQPSEQELADCLFAWQVAQHVKSNAIVLAHQQATIGIGAGQMSRIDSTELALSKAARAELSIEPGCVLASDGFFPFADSIQQAVKAGVSTIIQPGGSMRDDEVIAAADQAGLAMILTGIRHFWH